MKPLTIALLVLFFVTASATAQNCEPSDTPETCWNKFNPASAVADTVAKTNTGAPDLSTVSNTTLRDFLSVFTAAFSTSTLTQNDGALTLDYNLPVDMMHDHDVIKFQATFAKPDLDPALKTALSANAGAITTLSDSLDEADDITASATYSPSTNRFGRTFANHRDLVEGLMNAVGAKANPTLFLAKLGDILAASGDQNFDETKLFSTLPAPQQQAAITATERAARAQLEFAAGTQTVIDNVAELINNQEQLYFSAQYHDLNSLAGASSWAIKATYAVGGKNITKFLAAQKNSGNCDVARMVQEQNPTTTPTASIACLTALETYIGKATIDRTWRIAASLDISRTDANEIAISQLATPIKTPQSDSQVISLTAGRRFDPPSSSRERRIDITASYENVSDDPNRDDRLVGSITWTQELSDKMSLPITLSYANKSKYLPDNDKHLSAHFAISYKLPKMSN
jgi:hypothetical protein